MGKELIEFCVEGIKWLVGGGIAYFTFLFGSQTLSELPFKGNRIESTEELEETVKKEATKLGLDPSKIDIKYSILAGAYKEGERYILYIDHSSSKKVVKHELYHMLKEGDRLGRPVNFLYYLFVAELRATLYECFNIKL